MNKTFKVIGVVLLSSCIGVSLGFAAKPKKKYVQSPIPAPSIPWPISCFSLADVLGMDAIPIAGGTTFTAVYTTQCSFGNSNGGCKISTTSNIWNVDTGKMVYSDCSPANLACGSGIVSNVFIDEAKADHGRYLWIFQVYPTACPVSGNYLSSAFLFFTL